MEEDKHPEVYTTLLCNIIDTARFHSIIGSPNWPIALGRFNIYYATMSLIRFNMAPREGHIKHTKRILAYIKTVYK